MTKDFNKIYTKKEILDQLAQMNIPRNRVVLIHPSLRLIGRIDGGAQALLDTLIEYFTADGGLFCVPTHTWHNLKQEITLDMNDPTTALGAFPDLAAADPRGIRSQNPTHSMVVFGDRARALDFIKDEPYVTSGTDPKSCYGKLYRDGGYVLLVGVDHSRNTYLHCVDEMLEIPNRLNPEPLKTVIKLASGELVKRQIRLPKADFIRDVSWRFSKYETAFRYHGAITDGWIGNAPTQCCDARIMKDVIERIWSNCGDTDPLGDEKPMPPKWYC